MFIEADLNDSVTAADRAFYPEPYTNVALFLQGVMVMRYDLVAKTFERASLGQHLLESLNPAIC